MVAIQNRCLLVGLILGALVWTGCRAETGPSKAPPETEVELLGSPPSNPMESLEIGGETPTASQVLDAEGEEPPQELTVDTKNIFRWHPTEPFRLWRGPTPDELIDGTEFGWVTLAVHEVEIRLDPPEHEASTIILHMRTDQDFLKWGDQEGLFGLSYGLFNHLRVPWDAALPIDVELRYTRRNTHSDLKSDLAQLQTLSESPTELQPEKAIIASLKSQEWALLNTIYTFDLWSASQKRPDGSKIGFDHQDIKAFNATLDERTVAGLMEGEPESKVLDRPTKVVFWHPGKPIILREKADSDAQARGDYDTPLELNVHEVEMRFGAARHETYTVILRMKTDKAFLEQCIAKTRFGFLEVIFSRMGIPWDDALPVDIEVHYRRVFSGIELLTDFAQIRKARLFHWEFLGDPSDIDPRTQPFEPDKTVIEALTSGLRNAIAHVQNFALRSVRQTLPDGTVIGFDYNDIEALRKRNRASFHRPAKPATEDEEGP